MSDLVKRLRAFAAGCRGSMWQSRDETIALCDQSADEITALRARLEAMEKDQLEMVKRYDAMTRQVEQTEARAERAEAALEAFDKGGKPQGANNEVKGARPMGDLVKRLEDPGEVGFYNPDPKVEPIKQEAADEIIRLRARLEDLEAAIDSSENDGNMWRFWSDKARKLATSNSALKAALATARRDAYERAAQTVLAEAYHAYNEKPRVPEALMEAADAIRALANGAPE